MFPLGALPYFPLSSVQPPSETPYPCEPVHRPRAPLLPRLPRLLRLHRLPLQRVALLRRLRRLPRRRPRREGQPHSHGGHEVRAM